MSQKSVETHFIVCSHCGKTGVPLKDYGQRYCPGGYCAYWAKKKRQGKQPNVMPAFYYA
jgi:hypothetical protein